MIQGLLHLACFYRLGCYRSDGVPGAGIPALAPFLRQLPEYSVPRKLLVWCKPPGKYIPNDEHHLINISGVIAGIIHLTCIRAAPPGFLWATGRVQYYWSCKCQEKNRSSLHFGPPHESHRTNSFFFPKPRVWYCFQSGYCLSESRLFQHTFLNMTIVLMYRQRLCLLHSWAIPDWFHLSATFQIL